MGWGDCLEGLCSGWWGRGRGELPSVRGLQSSCLFSLESKPEHIGICSVAVRWGALKGSISWLKAGSCALWITRESRSWRETQRELRPERLPLFFLSRQGPSIAFLGFDGSGLLFPPHNARPLLPACGCELFLGAGA